MTARRTIALALAALCTWTASAAAGEAAPGAVHEADAHFRHGVELYKDNDYAAALVEFRRAYQLDPKFQVLYNIAEASFQLQDYATALRTFQKYLNEGGTRISTSRRAEVEREIDKLRKRVARLEVLTEAGASISVDDVAAGTAPLDEALLVSAGRRKITVSKAGRPPVTQIVEIAGGDTRTVKLDLPQIAPERVEVVVPQQPTGSNFPYVPWVITGGFAAGAVVTGIVALGASSDLKKQLGRFPGDADAISSARSKTAAFALITDVLIGATAVSGGLSLYITLHRPKPASSGAAPGAAPAAMARLVVLPGGAAVRGSF